MEENEFISQSDASMEYKIHRSKLRKWIADGKLESYQSERDMRLRLVKRSDIERLIGVRRAETPATTPKPATMGASLEGDAPSLKELVERANRSIADLTDEQARQVYEANRSDPLEYHLILHRQYQLQDRLGERARRDRHDEQLDADNINSYVENGTGELTEDERFRIENGLPS